MPDHDIRARADAAVLSALTSGKLTQRIQMKLADGQGHIDWLQLAIECMDTSRAIAAELYAERDKPGAL